MSKPFGKSRQNRTCPLATIAQIRPSPPACARSAAEGAALPAGCEW